MKKSFYHTTLIQLIVSCMLPIVALAQPTEPITLDYLAPQSYVVEAIEVEGAQTLDKEAIIALAGIKAGDVIDLPGNVTTEAIRRLWKQQLIKDLAIYATRIEDHRVVLTIHITESPRLSDYTFEGIKKKEQEKLLEELSLIKGEVVTEELIKNTKQAIEHYWIDQGYLYPTVTITSLPDATQHDHMQLIIKVDKGEKLYINAIQFKGNQYIDSDVLKSQLQHIQEKRRFTLVKDVIKQIFTLQPIRENGVFWRPLDLGEASNYFQKHVILFSSKFDPSKFEKDKKQLIDYYQSQGFRDVAIVEETLCQHDKGQLDISINIEEGKQYRIGAISWTGNYLYDDEILSQVLGIKEGDIYNPSLIQQRLYQDPNGQDIAALYADRGHLFFSAEPIEVGLEGDKVALEIAIQEGPEVRINKVLIEGNTITQDDVIRRDLRTLPGDKFNRAALQRSYRELVMLNILDPAAITHKILPNFADNTVDIKYKVKDRPKFEVKFSGTVAGGKEGFIGGVGLATNNFSLSNLFKGKLPVGEGQTLELSAETNGKQYKSFSIQFIEPWLGGKKPRQLYVSLNRSFEGNTGSMGGKLGLGTRLSWPDDYTVLRSTISYYRHHYKGYDLLDTGRRFTKNNGVLNDLSTTISLERDSTDSPIYPKRGSKVELTANLTPPWSLFSKTSSEAEQYRWKEYQQWLVGTSHFWRLFDNLVLNVRGQFGILGNYSSQQSIGPFERFYLGGGGNAQARALRGKEIISLRGYQEEYFTPRSTGTRYYGGVIYDKFVAELRYPIISNYFASIYALAFAEAGNTWAHYKRYNTFDLKRSAGLGIRMYIPMIAGTTLGFDWGYGFDKKANDRSDKLEFHFSFGTSSR